MTGKTVAMLVRRAEEEDRPQLAGLAARLQARPERHVAYFGLDATTIAAEMTAEDDDWTAVSAVAERDGDLVGWLIGSVDEEMGRVWWFGPFVGGADTEWSQPMAALHEFACGLLPTAVTGQEWAPDARYRLLIDWALAMGFTRDTGSTVLTLDDELAPPTIGYRHVSADDVETVGRLHDELFAGTHTSGSKLVSGGDDDHFRLVVEIDGTVAGYVAVERQPDGGGYIDYLGVEPSLRRRGLGAELVRAGVTVLRANGCDRCHLTVREDNDGARALYTALGFTEERTIAPLRKGFSLG